MRRFIGLILALTLLIGLGVCFFPGAGDSLSQMLTGFFSASESGDSRPWPLLAIDGASGEAHQDTSQADWRPVHLEPAPPFPLEQALNFQMTIPRILGNWPQVSTGIKEDSLFGYRVPFVSGTEESDVTGSLTYFFGTDQMLYRIDFTGDTGDARRLVAHVARSFQMQRQRSAEQGVFLYRTSEEVSTVGELRIRPRTIIHTTRPHQRFEISLHLSRFNFDE